MRIDDGGEETADVLRLGSGAAVSLQLRRLVEAMPANRRLRQQVDRIVAALAAPQADKP